LAPVNTMSVLPLGFRLVLPRLQQVRVRTLPPCIKAMKQSSDAAAAPPSAAAGVRLQTCTNAKGGAAAARLAAVSRRLAHRRGRRRFIRIASRQQHVQCLVVATPLSRGASLSRPAPPYASHARVPVPASRGDATAIASGGSRDAGAAAAGLAGAAAAGLAGAAAAGLAGAAAAGLAGAAAAELADAAAASALSRLRLAPTPVRDATCTLQRRRRRGARSTKTLKVDLTTAPKKQGGAKQAAAQAQCTLLPAAAVQFHQQQRRRSPCAGFQVAHGNSNPASCTPRHTARLRCK